MFFAISFIVCVILLPILLYKHFGTLVLPPFDNNWKSVIRAGVTCIVMVLYITSGLCLSLHVINPTIFVFP